MSRPNRYIERPTSIRRARIEELMNDENLQSLRIVDMALDAETADLISNVFTSSPNLNEIYMEWTDEFRCSSNLDAVTVLVNALIALPDLRLISLRLKPLDEHLTLKFIMGVSALLMTEETSIQEISLRGNRLDYEAATSLGHALSANSSLQMLMLKFPIGNQTGALSLAQSLKENSTLNSLEIYARSSLTQTSWLTEMGVIAFVNALRTNASLSKLVLDAECDRQKVILWTQEATAPMNTTLVEFGIPALFGGWVEENRWFHENYIDATIASEAIIPVLLAKSKRIVMSYLYLRTRIDLVVRGLQFRPQREKRL